MIGTSSISREGVSAPFNESAYSSKYLGVIIRSSSVHLRLRKRYDSEVAQSNDTGDCNRGLQGKIPSISSYQMHLKCVSGRSKLIDDGLQM